MSEENVGLQMATQGAEPASTSASEGSADTDTSVKSQGPEGITEKVETVVKEQPKEGQGLKPPTKADSKAAKGAKTAPASSWSADELRWMQSKGYDVSAFDASNLAHKMILESSRNAESAMHKAQQEAKSKELIEKAKVSVESTTAPDAPKSPLDQYEANFKAEVEYAMGILGVSDVNALTQQNPELAERFNRAYVVNRQKAWEETQNWKVEQEKQAEKKAQERIQLENDFKQMGSTMKANFDAAKAKNPAFETVWRESGADNILDWLDKTHTLPKEFVLQNPQVFEWFSDAAQAMEYRKHEDDRKSIWQQDYEKQLKKTKGAQVPSATGSDRIASFVDHGNSSNDWSKNLEAAMIKKG